MLILAGLCQLFPSVPSQDLWQTTGQDGDWLDAIFGGNIKSSGREGREAFVINFAEFVDTLSKFLSCVS